MNPSKISRSQKRNILLAFDTAVVPFTLYLAFVLRFSDLWPARQLEAALPLFVVMSVLGPVVMLGCRLPWIKLTALTQ